MSNLFKKTRLKESLTKNEAKLVFEAIDRLEHLTSAIIRKLSPEEHKLALKDVKYIQSLSKKSDK